MSPTTIVLIALVWAVVGLAVAVWRVRRRVILLDDMATRTAHNLISAEANLKLDIHELEDSRSRTASDLEAPDVDDHPDAPDQPTTPTYRPVPPDFNTNR